MTHDDKEWVVSAIRIGLAESRKELLEKDVPTLIRWHQSGCPIGKWMAMVIGGLVVLQVALTIGVAFAVKLL